ncbi:MAG: FMN-binding protein [Clostridiales bacterium]|nr:FMN-binding protein [Clostridiales bacterium]
MTFKEFLKSKTFKCIIVLTTIALVCGGLLAILNDVLYISEEEKTQKAIKKIYGKDMEYTVVQIDEQDKTNKYGQIEAIYAFKDGNYLIQATGIDGYQSGTITAWVVAEFKDGKFNGLNSVSEASNEKQTLMSKFNKDFVNVYVNKDREGVINGKYFNLYDSDKEIGNISSGATKSTNAYNNAVNCALYYIREKLDGGK